MKHVRCLALTVTRGAPPMFGNLLPVLALPVAPPAPAFGGAETQVGDTADIFAGLA